MKEINLKFFRNAIGIGCEFGEVYLGREFKVDSYEYEIGSDKLYIGFSESGKEFMSDETTYQ